MSLFSQDACNQSGVYQYEPVFVKFDVGKVQD